MGERGRGRKGVERGEVTVGGEMKRGEEEDGRGR